VKCHTDIWTRRETTERYRKAYLAFLKDEQKVFERYRKEFLARHGKWEKWLGKYDLQQAKKVKI